MAISLKATGAWARMVTDNGTVALAGGSPASGDRMFLWGAWKDFSITVADPAGWTSIAAFADGTVSAGNGTGSVKVAAWYRDWVSGDTDPAINYSAEPTEGHWVIQLWTKASNETWDAPTSLSVGFNATDPWSATAASIDIKDGAVVFELVALRDDSATMARDANTSLVDTGPNTVTWNGNIVESPAAHFSSTTGLDMSGDLIHRFVTTGNTVVALGTTGDPVAAETGACLWVHQGVTAAATEAQEWLDRDQTSETHQRRILRNIAY